MNRHPFKTSAICTILVGFFSIALPSASADEPYARTRDYDLQNVRTHLWFDLDHRAIRGEVTESVAILRSGTERLRFDSVELTIDSVTLDGAPATFSTTPTELLVSLVGPGAKNERHEILIRYHGQPKKGLYFVLPDASDPHQQREIFTQGEAEDTRYYIPIYDYPNDRTTSEMILTVPATWTTISNGKLIGVTSESDGTKTWDWKQSDPISTYLISAIAGEFDEKDDTWNDIPLRYVVPRGESAKIDPSFSRTKQMLTLFSEKLGVNYPWAQYAQTSVDDFVEGGMENTSATTLGTGELVDPRLVAEQRIGSDVVYSHELAHQWFGDLVTTKDWTNLWLNEGFATYFEHYWLEQHYSREESDYEFWRDASSWFRQRRLFSVPIVQRNFTDTLDFEGNIYTKGGWVLNMLREQLGDADFFAGLHNYLTTNRGQNVVTADLQKAIEQATSVNVDKFFRQWVYGAGAPQFEVSYSYDDSAHQVKLDVKQTQKVEGMVGLFDIPISVEITTNSGRKVFPIEVSQASQSFTFPADGATLMVLFDKGNQILETTDFKKDPAMLIYQLKHADAVPDRADAAVALGQLRDNPDAVAALADAAAHDSFWGVQVEALRALGRTSNPSAEAAILVTMSDAKPWVREFAATQLGGFASDASLGEKLADYSTHDSAFRVRAAALRSLGRIKSPQAYDLLTAAAKSDSPDDVLRNAALSGLGSLGDSRAVPLLLGWSEPGKPAATREAAVNAISGMDKGNKKITNALISYLNESHYNLRITVVFALGRRGDIDAVAALENRLKSPYLGDGEKPMIENALAMLKPKSDGAKPAADQ